MIRAWLGLRRVVCWSQTLRPGMVGLALFLVVAMGADWAEARGALRLQEAGLDSAAATTVDKDAANAAKSAAASEESSVENSPAEPLVYLAITNVTLHTMERDGVIASGTVLMADGKIVAVGKAVEIPAGAEVIDGQGFHLTPGLIDVRSRLYLGPSSADQAGADGSLDAIDGVDRFTSYGQEVLAAGVTAVYLQPGASGSLGGYGATVATGSAEGSAGELSSGVLQAPAAVQMALGGVARAGTSRARRQQYEALQKRLKDAKDYQKAWDDYRAALKKQAESKAESKAGPPAEKPAGEAAANPAADEAARGSGETPANRPRRRPGPPPQAAGDGEETTIVSDSTEDAGAERPAFGVVQEPRPQRGGRSGGRPMSGVPAGQDGAQAAAGEAAGAAASEPKKPAFDPLKERLLPVLKRELPVRFEVRQAEEIGWALSLAQEFNLRLVLEGLTEMKSATAAVRESQAPVVLGPWLNGAGGRETAEATRAWAEVFGPQDGAANALVNRVVIATFSEAPAGSKWLRQHAAMAVAAGLSADQALRGMTIEAAQVSGVGERLGSLRPGKQADLVLFAGQPLDVTAPVALVIQAGKVVWDQRSQMGAATVQAAESPVAESPAAGSPAAESLAAGASFSDPVKALPAVLPARYAVVSRRLLTGGGSWMSSAMLVEDGRIAGCFDTSELPADVPVYDLGDSPVTPGLQSAWWVNPSAGTPISKDSNAAQQFAADGFDPSAANVQRLLESGVNAVHVVNGPDNVVAGQTAWLRLPPSSSGGSGERRGAAEQWVLTERARNIERFPSTLVGQVSLLRDRLAGRGDATTLYLPEAAVAKLMAQRSAQLQAVQSGKLPVVVAVESDGEIDAALRLLAGTEVQAWLYGAVQVRPFAERLAESGVGLIVNPISESTFDWYLEDLVDAQARGVSLLLAGRHGNELRATAAALVAAGMSRDEARDLLMHRTEYAFDPNALGALQVGAPAEFLVWSGDPLELTSRLIWTSWGK